MSKFLTSTLFNVVTGKIKDPVLELEVDGENQIFKGREAKVFAFGVLTGMKTNDKGVSINLNKDAS